jgi:hypothetical protein
MFNQPQRQTSRKSAISKLQSSGKIQSERINIQTREHPVGGLEILWNLDFGTWNFPTNRKFREAGLRA